MVENSNVEKSTIVNLELEGNGAADWGALYVYIYVFSIYLNEKKEKNGQGGHLYYGVRAKWKRKDNI